MTISLTLVQGAYIVAGLLFILALAGLSRHESARAGNRYGIVGMTIALIITITAAVGGVDATGEVLDTEGTGLLGFGLIVVAMAIGGAIGIWRARRVEMTGMPELIAMLHSFVGLAAVLVGWNSSYEKDVLYPAIHDVEVFVGVFIGAVTLTGSIVAYL
ncbi:MAG: NAD(P)(+) transhydrogenase (Re/Si-specific) subunit beta, partial [Actinomycetia bacterium]|nr:NAD(P)(+) transhydrogenase (Re/Si-specific) subunit beta [Actinomycetes bacterium]